jgi:hypothetical protein
MKNYMFEIRYMDNSIRHITVSAENYKRAYYSVLDKITLFNLVYSITFIR